ncbi:MAG: zinc-dependent alcohol dehydrogenase family protein [Planctomycetota bacterium]
MVLHEIGPIESSPLRLQQPAPPAPGAGELRLRVRCCAVCRTDLHVIEGDLPRQTLPIIPGHQIVGTVDALGAGVSGWRVGDRAGAAWLRGTCGRCDFCTAGRENLCPHSRYTGYHEHGGYAEYAVVPADFAYAIPAAFTDIDAAPLLCAGIIGYRALKRCHLQDGTRLALYGFGSSAHVVMQIALYRGCEVYVVSRTDRHLELARDMGARWVGTDAAQMPVRVDSAIVFAPAGSLVPTALEHLEKGGTLALAGITMSAVPALDYEKHLFYEKNVHSVTANTRADATELLAEAAEIPIRPHVTQYAVADANRALQDLKADRLRGTGVLVVA